MVTKFDTAVQPRSGVRIFRRSVALLRISLPPRPFGAVAQPWTPFSARLEGNRGEICCWAASYAAPRLKLIDSNFELSQQAGAVLQRGILGLKLVFGAEVFDLGLSLIQLRLRQFHD